MFITEKLVTRDLMKNNERSWFKRNFVGFLIPIFTANTIAYSRLAFKMHFISDVIFGAIIGASCAYYFYFYDYKKCEIN